MNKYIPYFFLLFFISLLSFILFFSSDSVKFHTVTVADKICISIPEYLAQTNSIDPAAILQYKNEKEQLVLLIYEKTDTLNSSTEILFKKFSTEFMLRIGYANLVKYYPKEINSHHAVVGNIRGKVNETGVYYRIAVIEAGNTYYEVIAGVSENHFVDFNDDIDTILSSITIQH